MHLAETLDDFEKMTSLMEVSCLFVGGDQAEWSKASTIGFDPKGPWFDARWRRYFTTENIGTLLAKKLAIQRAYSWY